MKRIDEDTIQMSQAEADAIAEFIRSSLHREWDHYTDRVIVEKTTWEEGMRSMNPEMYDAADHIQQL